ncbi:MAG: preprotein translocase subunit YajC [Clostridiales bacterium]|jgi:preprotein translocase YajC subunit|nr:preprotein translocase subunit YajC [Clostridiales bacterium]
MDIIMYVMIGVIVLMFGFQFISGRKKNKQREALLNSIGPGTKILTVGGFYGTVRGVTTENKVIVDLGTPESETLVVLSRQGIRNIESNYAANAVGTPSVAPAAEPKKEDGKDDK